MEMCSNKKLDTRFGKLLDIAFKYRYGEDFKWKEAKIENLGEGNFIVRIESENLSEPSIR